MMDYKSDSFYQEENIDIKKFLFKILSNWYWFALSLFIALTAAYLVNRYSEPIFSVSSTLIVRDDQKGKGLTGAEQVIEGMEIFRSTKNVQNEIGILQSYFLANKAILELKEFEVTYILVGRRGIKEAKLYTRSPFKVNIDTSHYQLRGYPIYVKFLSGSEYKLELDEEYNINEILKFGEEFENDNLKFNITMRDAENFNLDQWTSNKFYFIINNLNALTNQYRGKLSVTVNDKKGSILTLSTQGYVAQQEVDYLNKLSEVYIRSGLEEKNKTAENTLTFIDEQLKEIVDSLTTAEINLQNFRLNNQIIDISKEGSAIFEKLEKFQSEKTLIAIRLKYYDYLMKYIEEKNDFLDVISPSIMGINDPLLISLISKLAELYAEKGELLYSTRENSPLLNLSNVKIQNARASLLENVNNIINTTNISLKDVNQRIAEVKAEVQKLPVTERELIGIQRMFNLNDDLYTYLLEKRAEAGIARASNISDNKILDIARGENAGKVTPKNSLNYMIALILGVVIPILIILLIDFFNNRIIDKKDIEDLTNVAIIGSIGHNSTDSDIPVAENSKSAIAESFRSLRTNIQYLLTEPGKKIISVSSTITGEGKTFVATNLASIIAMSNKKTLLLGLDMRKPKIYKDFSIDNETGMSTYLINKSSYEEIIHPTESDNLWVTTSGPSPPNPAELLETEIY
ncbi:MAG: tyrosine protein kinase, partial [Bacteroidetes bacterium]|nr:tyrosine protein kinase [Bacteroidota bacterium]